MQSDTINLADRPVEADETSRLISSEKVDGTAVYNGEGQLSVVRVFETRGRVN
jgi:hypothetical protein